MNFLNVMLLSFHYFSCLTVPSCMCRTSGGQIHRLAKSVYKVEAEAVGMLKAHLFFIYSLFSFGKQLLASWVLWEA